MPALSRDEAALDAPGSPLVDTFGRVHRDLRISLTDRCSLRCTYCMPEQGNEWLARSSILTLDEIERVARVAAAAGVTTFRLTGGEPLLRTDIVDVVRRLAVDRGPRRRARRARDDDERHPAAGAASRPHRRGAAADSTSRSTRCGATGSATSRAAIGSTTCSPGSPRPRHPVSVRSKLNAVAMRDVNDDELVDLVAFALDHGAEMRFIEQMPLDAGHTWDRSRMVTRDEILDALSARWTLTPVPGRGGAPAERWMLDGGPATVGVIASVTAPFCGDCDRLRLTADGQLRNCLFSTTEYDLLPILRGARRLRRMPTSRTSTSRSTGCCAPACAASFPVTRSTTRRSCSRRAA